jgi:tartrate dehydrogenase/decarboxylase/D-malate dehydrogenase
VIAGDGIGKEVMPEGLRVIILGYRQAHDVFLAAIEKVPDPQSGAPRTPDLGGTASTKDVGSAIAGAN